MTNVSNARKPATWHAIVHTLDVLIATIMVMSQQLALTRYLLQVCQHNTGITPLVDVTGQHPRTATPDILTMTIETVTDSANLDPAHTTLDIEVTVVVIPAEAILDHFIDPHTVASHITEVPAHTATAVTHHITDPHHVHLSRGDSRSRTHKSSRQHYKPTQRSSSSSQTMPWKHKDRRHKQVTIDNPPSEYYSSDEQDSDSEDDLKYKGPLLAHIHREGCPTRTLLLSPISLIAPQSQATQENATKHK